MVLNMTYKSGDRIIASKMLEAFGVDITLTSGATVKGLTHFQSQNVIEDNIRENRTDYKAFIPTYDLHGLELGGNLIINSRVYKVNNIDTDVNKWATISMARTVSQIMEGGVYLTWNSEDLTWNGKVLNWQGLT